MFVLKTMGYAVICVCQSEEDTSARAQRVLLSWQMEKTVTMVRTNRSHVLFFNARLLFLLCEFCVVHH